MPFHYPRPIFAISTLLFAAHICASCDGDKATDMGGSPEPADSDMHGGETGETGDDPSPEETMVTSDPGFENTGLCGFSGQATAGAGIYAGTQDVYLIGDSGMGEDLCRVRFELSVVGEPMQVCADCEWSVLVEASMPTVVTDVDGICAASELMMNEAAIDAWIGKRMSYGYIPEFTGHENVLMSYDDTTSNWEAIAFATWDAETGEFSYDKRDGFCVY